MSHLSLASVCTTSHYHFSAWAVQVEYNLYGMGFVRFRKARFRGPLPGRGRRQRAGWDAVPEVLSYEEASTGGALHTS